MTAAQVDAAGALAGTHTLRGLLPADTDRAVAAAALLEELTTAPDTLLALARAAWECVEGRGGTALEVAVVLAPGLAAAVETTCARSGCGHARDQHDAAGCGALLGLRDPCDCPGWLPYCASCGCVLDTGGGPPSGEPHPTSGDEPVMCRDCDRPDQQDVPGATRPVGDPGCATPGEWRGHDARTAPAAWTPRLVR